MKPMVCDLGNCSLGAQMSHLAYFPYTEQPEAHKKLSAITDLD